MVVAWSWHGRGTTARLVAACRRYPTRPAIGWAARSGESRVVGGEKRWRARMHPPSLPRMAWRMMARWRLPGWLAVRGTVRLPPYVVAATRPCPLRFGGKKLGITRALGGDEGEAPATPADTPGDRGEHLRVCPTGPLETSSGCASSSCFWWAEWAGGPVVQRRRGTRGPVAAATGPFSFCAHWPAPPAPPAPPTCPAWHGVCVNRYGCIGPTGVRRKIHRGDRSWVSLHG